MKERTMVSKVLALKIGWLCLMAALPGTAADHNDPNAVNSIFSDVAITSADLYGMFGYPSDDRSQGENVVVQLTFAPIPRSGEFDHEMLYKIHLDPDRRVDKALKEESLDGFFEYVSALKDQFLRLEAAEIKVSFSRDNRARVQFSGFPGEDFERIVPTNEVLTIQSPDGQEIKTFIGARDDPFFNDLPGFFRSINYGPQFYEIPKSASKELRELPIPKTLLELEENELFNFDPTKPDHGQGMKLAWPEDADREWNGRRFRKDAEGNYRLVYSGRDAQAGINVSAIIFEIPLAFVSDDPERERVVRVWGESWVLKASKKVDFAKPAWYKRFFVWLGDVFRADPDPNAEFLSDTRYYNRVDTVGVPFQDAALSQRDDRKNVGADNMRFGREFIKRTAHLGWGFGPSISALGLPTCFDHDDSPVSVHKTYFLASSAYPRAKKCFFQELRMPDDSWNPKGLSIQNRRVFELFVPNFTSIDMDTTGTWPFGRRPEDQVATRFLSIFLDMTAQCGDSPCHIETLNDLVLFEGAPLDPANVPNPQTNDRPFLDEFPYLGEPWPGH